MKLNKDYLGSPPCELGPYDHYVAVMGSTLDVRAINCDRFLTSVDL